MEDNPFNEAEAPSGEEPILLRGPGLSRAIIHLARSDSDIVRFLPAGAGVIIIESGCSTPARGYDMEKAWRIPRGLSGVLGRMWPCEEPGIELPSIRVEGPAPGESTLQGRGVRPVPVRREMRGGGDEKASTPRGLRRAGTRVMPGSSAALCLLRAFARSESDEYEPKFWNSGAGIEDEGCVELLLWLMSEIFPLAAGVLPVESPNGGRRKAERDAVASAGDGVGIYAGVDMVLRIGPGVEWGRVCGRTCASMFNEKLNDGGASSQS